MTPVTRYLHALALAPDSELPAPTDLPGPVRAALQQRDGDALALALGKPLRIWCSIILPEHDEPEPEEQPVTPDEEAGDGDARAA